MPIVVSYGGGVNSTAMLILMTNNQIVPDAILFADTGGEQAETYAYIDYFSLWLQRNGMPKIEIVRYKTKHGEELTLEQDIINNNTLPSIAFGFKTCSQKFKITPQEKYIKERWPDSWSITHYIGFDAGEPKRAKENPLEGHKNIYPLIMAGWDRQRCKDEIIKAGLCIPPKSSCFFCPNMKKHEVLKLSDVYKERIKYIEANATKPELVKGLGRTYAWTDLINADEKQSKLFDDLELYQSPCECID